MSFALYLVLIAQVFNQFEPFANDSQLPLLASKPSAVVAAACVQLYKDKLGFPYLTKSLILYLVLIAQSDV